MLITVSNYTMELFKLSMLAFALYAQLHTGVSSFSEDMDIWSLENWQVGTLSDSTVVGRSQVGKYKLQLVCKLCAVKNSNSGFCFSG